MSGIAGIIRFDGAPVEIEQLAKMTAAMAYRGPDGINHWVRGPVALGQCMLRTTPESLEESQPLTNEDESLVLTMDGRVDNWEDLRRELQARGAALRNRSDAELVLRAYEVWGRDCLRRIDGDFALVIWDGRQNEVFCARDRVGNKPLNYYWDGTTLVVASELHAILAMPCVPEDLNEGMVAEFLAGEWYSRDETLWKGIFRLDAAHRMVVKPTGLHLDQYWTPDLWATLPCKKEDDYVDCYRQLLTDAVRRTCRSFQPIACEVSGGLDSSGIFAVAEMLRRQDMLPAPGLEGYTLAFADESEANELEYARAVGRHLDRRIQEILPTRMQLSWYQQWASHYREFPSYPNGVMGLGIRECARDQRSRVLLSGVGGDEWLCGSRNHYAEALAAKQWDELLNCVQIDRRDVGLHTSLWWVFRHGLAPLFPEGSVKQLLRRLFTADRGELNGDAWLTPPMKRLLRQRREKYLSSAAIRTRQIRRRRQSVILSDAYLAHALEIEERMASSVGVELRRPFFDANLIQFAITIPDRYLLRGRTDKYLHRRALTRMLPPAVLTRTSKAEFGITFQWHLPEIRQLLNGKISKTAREWVKTGEVAKLLDAAGKSENSGWPAWMIWGLFGCDAVASGRTTSNVSRHALPYELRMPHARPCLRG